MQKYFPKDYRKCCVKISTIIIRMVSEKFLKYFVYGLNRGFKHFTKCFGKFNATFIEIFHASFLLRYLKHYTQTLAETFQKSFKKFSDFGLKLFQSIFQQSCRNIFRKITRNHVYKFALSLHGKFLKIICNILCLVWTEDTNISRNFLACLMQHLLKYFTQTSC